MSDLFTLRPAREGDWELINYYAYREGMDAIPSLENITVAANGDDDCVGFCRLAFSEAGIAHVNPVVINEQWRGYGVGRALIDDARAHHNEIRLVARGKSIEFYRVLGFTEIPWDDIAPGVTEEELLCVAASLEKPSEHPLADAITAEAQARNIPLAPVEDFLATPGRGIRGAIQGQQLLAGNRAMLEEAGVPLDGFDAVAEGLAQAGKTPLYFAGDGRMLGVVAVADTPKPTSAEAVRAFQAMGIDVVMLTGDNARTAEAVGRQLGVNRVVAEVLPQDKEKTVAELQAQGKRVAMVGDGINDAPALARADVGLAIGAGTDVAIESADIVLMKSDLRDAAIAVELSRATMRNIRENLFWAFFYNVCGIPLAAGVFYHWLGWQLDPMFAAAAMSLSSVCVVTNALRLRAFKSKHISRAIPADGEHKETASPIPAAPAETTKGSITMNTKTIFIEGMMCQHCVKHVQEALNAVPGVKSAAVSLENNNAVVTAEDSVTDEALAKAVTDADYKVVNIQ